MILVALCHLYKLPVGNTPPLRVFLATTRAGLDHKRAAFTTTPRLRRTRRLCRGAITADWNIYTLKEDHARLAIVMKVAIKEWNSVATWQWDIPEDDVCGICQVQFDGTCPTCKYPGDDCSLCMCNKYKLYLFRDGC